LVGQQIDRQYERRWTAILPALGDLLTLNPLSLIGSLFGGGSFRDVDLRIADLQVRVSDLVRRRAEVTVQLHAEVTELVMQVEKGDRQIALLQSQLANQQQRVSVMAIGYRLGDGTTEQMIRLWQQTEALEAKLTEMQVNREHSLRTLLERTGYEAATTDELDSTGGDRSSATGSGATLESE
jgi:outer membrane protein TolC